MNAHWCWTLQSPYAEVAIKSKWPTECDLGEDPPTTEHLTERLLLTERWRTERSEASNCYVKACILQWGGV